MNRQAVRRGLVLAVALALVALLCYVPFVHITAQHEVGLRLNLVNGSTELDGPGIHFSSPWVLVSKLETRPQRVCIASVAKVMVCKLVRFNPAHYADFVIREGFRYYWWDNRLSFNAGYSEEYRGFLDLLRGYGFEARLQPFLEVVSS